MIASAAFKENPSLIERLLLLLRGFGRLQQRAVDWQTLFASSTASKRTVLLTFN